MDPEYSLLNRMIQTGAVDQVTSAGVEERHFHDAGAREVFAYCVAHATTWRIPPSFEAVQRRFPDFRRQVVHDDLGYLIHEFNEECANRAAIVKWRDIGHMLEEVAAGRRPRAEITEQFLEHAREMVALVPTAHASRLSDMAERVATIKRQQQEGARPGVKIGIPVLDQWVYAVRPTKYVVHAAYSSIGKSTGLVRSAIQAFEEGERTLFFSLEMEGEEIWEMFDAAIVGLSRKAINRRELGHDDYERYERKAQELRARMESDIVVIDDTDGAPTIDKLAGRIERYGAGAVFVDYLSLMSATTSKLANWERVESISRSLKAMARSMGIKLYAAAQNAKDAADNGPTEENIAYSTAIFQDCDIMVGYHQDAVMAQSNKMEVRLVKMRGGERPRTSNFVAGYEHWDRDRMQFEPWRASHNWAMREKVL